MKKLTLLPLCTLALISGCTSLSPHFDREVELAVRTAKAQQIINPDGARNTDPVAGIDGKPADSAIDEYHKSFVAPPPTFPVINITGG
jgi:hypothetical protein